MRRNPKATESLESTTSGPEPNPESTNPGPKSQTSSNEGSDPKSPDLESASSIRNCYRLERFKDYDHEL